jgi:hypothetical protein
MLCALAATALAGAAHAQVTGYYPGSDASYAYRYVPPIAYGASGDYTPNTYYTGYDAYNDQDGYYVVMPDAAMAEAALEHARRDAYGPDPNGVLAPDGHRIKCKLVTDDRYGWPMKHRVCW